MLSWCSSVSQEPDEPAHFTHPESPTRRSSPRRTTAQAGHSMFTSPCRRPDETERNADRSLTVKWVFDTAVGARSCPARDRVESAGVPFCSGPGVARSVHAIGDLSLRCARGAAWPDEENSIGAVPLYAAKWPAVANLVTSRVYPMISAAMIGPTPQHRHAILGTNGQDLLDRADRTRPRSVVGRPALRRRRHRADRHRHRLRHQARRLTDCGHPWPVRAAPPARCSRSTRPAGSSQRDHDP